MLTERQRRILEIILDRNEKGESPTYEELGNMMGVDKAAAWAQVNTLAAKGLVEKGRGWRSIWAVRDFEAQEAKHPKRKRAARVPPAFMRRPS